MEAVSNGMQRQIYRAGVQEAGMAAFKHMCHLSELARIKAEVHAIKPTIEGLFHGGHRQHAGVVEQALGALRMFADDAKKNKTKIAQKIEWPEFSKEGEAGENPKSGIDAIVESMNTLQMSPGIIVAGCAAIVNLCYDSLFMQETLFKAGALQSILNGMSKQPYSPIVQEAGMAALINLCANVPPHIDKAAELNAVEIVVKGMKAHASVDRVQHQGCWCLWTLVMYNMDNKVKLAQVGGTEAIKVAKDRFPNHAGVQEYSDKVLNFRTMTMNHNNWRTAATKGEAKQNVRFPGEYI